MAQVREIKSRIANIKDIKQITKAMNAIAMAKVTRLKKQLNKARPYQEVINSKFEQLSDSGLQTEYDEEEVISPLLERGAGDALGLVVFNSDRGLSGNYTIDINRAARDFIQSRDEGVKLFAGGEKALQFFRKWDELDSSWVEFYQEPDFEVAEAIGNQLLDRYLNGSLGELWVVYMKFISDLKQELKIEKILPLQPDKASEETETDGTEGEIGSRGDEDYLFDPGERQIISGFLEEWFVEKIFWIILNTKASENAIRRKAMRDATDNANELIDDLTLTYNKARQQEITREIADIIGGAEALREE